VTEQTYSYRAYGLGINSTVPLPELIDAPSGEDVIIRRKQLEDVAAQLSTENGLLDANDTEMRFFWDGVGTFLVREGREIEIESFPDLEDPNLRLPLLGVISAMLLHQRGFLVLHSSAVEIDGEAVAFLGNKGMGKSTTAATLYGRGHRLITDDVLAIDVRDPEFPQVLPGFPQFKLWPEAAASALGDDGADLPHLVTGYDKRALRPKEDFSLAPVELKRIYVLDEGPVLEIIPATPQEALTQMVVHSYAARFPSLLQGNKGATHLMQCSNLLKRVPVGRLKRRYDLQTLPELAQLIERDVSSGASI
jgi:hypothetical protein